MPATRKAPVRGKWSADHLLQSPKSPLTKINLHALLSHPEAWTALSTDEQLELISMLPSHLQPDLPGINSTSTTQPADPPTIGAYNSASSSRLSSADPLAPTPPPTEPPPPATANAPPSAPIPHLLHSTLRHNPSFQSDLRLFTEDLAAGKHDAAWQRDAQAASTARAAGTYDAWKEAKREAFWGQKQRVDWTARAGDSAEHSLLTLVGAGCFEVGDVWVYRRGVGRAGRGADESTVEKEALLTSIDRVEGLEFRVARGKRIAVRKDGVAAGGGQDRDEREVGEDREDGEAKEQDGDGDVEMGGEEQAEQETEDLQIEGIKGPNRLAELLKAEDGRLKGVREANAWKSIRLFRRNQDLGSLWDVRESFHYRREKDSQ